jgi:hypothetical protein
MGWTRILAFAGAAVAASAGCRGGFDHRVPGLAEDALGLVLSNPGALVIEDGQYDLAPALDGDGYAAAWIEYPAGSPTPQLSFAIASEVAERRVGPSVLEIIPDGFNGVRLFTGADGYLVVFGRAGNTVYAALDADGRVRARHTDGTSVNRLGAVATANGYVLVDHSNGVVRTRSLDRDGGLVSAAVELEPPTDPATEVDPTIARSGAQLAAAWVDTRTGDQRVRFAKLADDGTIAGPSVQVYEDGHEQGLPYLVPDGTDGFLLVHDAYDAFPQVVMRIDANGAPRWSAPALIYDEPRYHDTLDVAGTAGGSGGFAWITERDTLLANVYVAVLDGNVASAPATPAAALVSDPAYSFCYPEVARGGTSFGALFAGEVEGSLALFLAIVPD